MKFATVAKSLVLGLALMLASSAFAGNSANKANLQLQNPVTVGGTQLKAGDYKLQWEGSGPNVEVSILQGKNVVAKVPARVVDLQDKANNDAAVTQRASDGSKSLTGVRFGGKKYALELGETSEAMQSGGSSK